MKYKKFSYSYFFKYNEFLCEVFKLIQAKNNENDQSLILIRNKFMSRFGKENYQDIDSFLDSLSPRNSM